MNSILQTLINTSHHSTSQLGLLLAGALKVTKHLQASLNETLCGPVQFGLYTRHACHVSVLPKLLPSSSSPFVSRWNSHVHLVLVLIVPNQQLLSDTNVPRRLEIETVVMLQCLQILFVFVPCTLDEVHPVSVPRVTGINEVGQRGVLVYLRVLNEMWNKLWLGGSTNPHAYV